jgi:cytoskeletal protein CcmA (bactofilin family)
MNHNKARSLTISGIGSTHGGTVYSARIDGIGKVEGDISCSDFRVNGKAEIQGSVEARTAEIHGTAKISGRLQADRIRVHGHLIVESGLTGEHIHLHGTVEVKGDCEAESLDGNGKFQLNSLNAGTVRITMNGSSSIAEIGGEHIQIRKQPGSGALSWIPMLSGRFACRMTAQIIEGDTIYLEYTKAELVRENEIKIGPGCEIELVEYKTKFDGDSGSTISRLEQS